MKKSSGGFSALWHKAKSFLRDSEKQASYGKWLFFYAKPYIPRILLMVALNLVGSLLAIGMALVSKTLIDRATAGGGELWQLVALYVLCIVVSLSISAGCGILTTMVSERFSFGIRLQIYNRIIHSRWIDSQRFHTGDLMTRLTSDAGNISEGIVSVAPDIVRLLLELLVMFFTLFYFSPLLAVFALILSPVAGLLSLVFGRILKRMQVKVQETEANYRSFLQESLANLLIVKSFSNEDYSVERLTVLRNERFYWLFKKTRLSIAASSLMSLTFQIGYIVAFAYGAIQVSKKIITYGTMSVFITLVARIQAPVFAMAHNLPKLVSMVASAGRVMELQKIAAEPVLEESVISGSIGVRMRGISFAYDDEPVFENVSLDIRPGEFVAIIGESGIGKTTLVRLLMSFAEGQEGKVEFYGGGKAEQAGAQTRRFVSYVPQGNTLFSGTIRENIRMGKLDATEEELLEALRLASGYSFVTSLPGGLDTRIGERGHGLSEGQSQRIAIARALVRKAPVLIFDEATSALDEQTELAVLGGLCRLEPKPTCLLITHRKSVLSYCDRSIRIEDKRIVEE